VKQLDLGDKKKSSIAKRDSKAENIDDSSIDSFRSDTEDGTPIPEPLRRTDFKAAAELKIQMKSDEISEDKVVR
jgi:hypothetical protein